MNWNRQPEGIELLSNHPLPQYSEDLDPKSATSSVLDKEQFNYDQLTWGVPLQNHLERRVESWLEKMIVDCSESSAGTIRTVIIVLRECFEMSLDHSTDNRDSSLVFKHLLSTRSKQHT